jgi:hypothetical protein
VKESLDVLEDSSQRLEAALAVLWNLRDDPSGSSAVLKESLPVVFPSKPVVSGSRDDVCESKA